MKRYPLRSLLAVLLVGIAPALMLWATPIFDPFTQTCTGINCGAIRLDGNVMLHTGNARRPWTIEIFSNAGSCLRAHVTAQDQDWEAVLVAPNGTVYRNDDIGSGACPNCPLITADPAPITGFYTLQLSHFSGAPVAGEFTLFYGLYNSGNTGNCSSPTPPMFDEVNEAHKAES